MLKYYLYCELYSNICSEALHLQRPKYRTFDQSINFNLRRDPQKISYERRAHDSEDEKSLS